jgi:hypothetical protein
MDNSTQCAFPTGCDGDPGLTKREYAAIQIAAGLAATEVEGAHFVNGAAFAGRAVSLADALLAELAK